MADFDNLLGEDAANSRISDLVQSFCGDECGQDEFVIMGTGQVVDLKRLGNAENPTHISSEINKGGQGLLLSNFYPIYLSTIGVIVVLALTYISYINRRGKLKKGAAAPRSPIKSNIKTDLKSERMRESGEISPRTPNFEDNEPILLDECDSPKREPTLVEECDSPDESLPNLIGNFSENSRISLIDESQSGNSITCGRQSVIEKNTESPLSSLVPQLSRDSPYSLSLLSENDIKQHVGDMARNMSVLMTEFESAMKEQGYTVSQSDVLAIANQRLLSIEALQMAKASEARHYLYDSQQRHVDRVLADRRHEDVLEAQEQDKDWLQKLQAARDKCHDAILPAIQRSFVSVAVCFVVYHSYQYRNYFLYLDGSISNFVLIMFHKYTIPIPPIATLEEEDMDGGANVGSPFVVRWWWSVHPFLSVLLRMWSFILVPFTGLAIYVVANFILPAMLMQLAKTGLVFGLLAWAMSSIPWQNLCIGQFAFLVVAQLWSLVGYNRVYRALGRPDRPCPTNKELVRHLAVFDDSTRFMTMYSCLVNLAIILYEVTKIRIECQNDPNCFL